MFLPVWQKIFVIILVFLFSLKLLFAGDIQDVTLATLYLNDKNEQTGVGGQCTGVIVGKAGNTYYGLTAGHCYTAGLRIGALANFTVWPPSSQTAGPIKAKYLAYNTSDNADLALFSFECDKSLPVVRIAKEVNPVNAKVFSIGYPLTSKKQVVREGYTKANYHNWTNSSNYYKQGESGGPVINQNGELIGIISGYDHTGSVDTSVPAIRYFLTECFRKGILPGNSIPILPQNPQNQQPTQPVPNNEPFLRENGNNQGGLSTTPFNPEQPNFTPSPQYQQPNCDCDCDASINKLNQKIENLKVKIDAFSECKDSITNINQKLSRLENRVNNINIPAPINTEDLRVIIRQELSNINVSQPNPQPQEGELNQEEKPQYYWDFIEID